MHMGRSVTTRNSLEAKTSLLAGSRRPSKQTRVACPYSRLVFSQIKDAAREPCDSANEPSNPGAEGWSWAQRPFAVGFHLRGTPRPGKAVETEVVEMVDSVL